MPFVPSLAGLRHGVILGAAIVSLFALDPALGQGREIVLPANSPLRGGITVEAVSAVPASLRLELPAVIEADPVLTQKIVPPVPGRLHEVLVAVGDHVRKGQLVARLEALDAGAGEKPRIVDILSPATGTITEMTAAQGAFYDVPLQPFATVARFDMVRATMAVPEKHVGLARKGEAVALSLIAYPGQNFHGRVAAVADMLDPQTRRLSIRATLPNRDGLLKPGMFGTATIEAAASRMPRVPVTALVLDGTSDAVFVETSPWHFVKRRIRSGLQDGDSVYVSEGLASGDRVVVKGAVLLND